MSAAITRALFCSRCRDSEVITHETHNRFHPPALGRAVYHRRAGLRLGRAAVDMLLDGDAPGVAGKIREAALGVAGVRGVGQVRARLSGPEAFVDISVEIARETSFEDAHGIGDNVEDAVRAVLPGADVVVHLEPVAD